MSNKNGKKLSIWRLTISLLIGGAIVGLGFRNISSWFENRGSNVNAKPWLASYVDVTSFPTFSFEQVERSEKHKDIVLSFVVSSNTNDSCIPSWGGVYTLDQASNSLDLDRRIERLRQLSGDVAVSFGGLKNEELALGCSDQSKLTEAYESVLTRYDLNTIDFDLENKSLTDKDAGLRRAKAIHDLQAARRKKGKNLAVWITLPVTPQGLNQDGTNAIAQLLEVGVDIAGINIMTMDFGQSLPVDSSMFDASRNALIKTQKQLGVLYRRSGINLSDLTLWSKMGVTPMIGQNDFVKEVFTLKDAENLNNFALSHGVKRISMWSANRDIACGNNYVNLKVVSDSCSGIQQKKRQFTDILGLGFEGSFSYSAELITTAEKQLNNAITPDDQATSPYQIWSPKGAYLKGTKVVWHHHVYQAKWWTQGDTPDNPVLQEWETPWELVGPVLPGEKPIIQPTLPAGTYPEWSGDQAYNVGERVIFDGVPFQAKWWTKGDSPAAASANQDSSPWVPLTQEQINQLIKR